MERAFFLVGNSSTFTRVPPCCGQSKDLSGFFVMLVLAGDSACFMYGRLLFFFCSSTGGFFGARWAATLMP